MNSSRRYFLIILIAVILIVGLIFRRVEILILATPLLVYIGAAALLSPHPVRLTAERELTVYTKGGSVQPNPPLSGQERVLPAHSEISMRLKVANTGASLGEAIIIDQGWRYATNLMKGEVTEWEYRFRPVRGRLQFADLRIQVGDVFGLFVNELPVPALMDGMPRLALLTLPETIELRKIPIRPPRLSGFAGPVVAKAPGSSTDFYGVREYQPGDSPRRLNWRLSSRYERQLYTNQYEGERYADIGVILDARYSRYMSNPIVQTENSGPIPGTSGPFGDLFEYAVIVAASLIRAFLEDGQRVSLLVYGYSTERIPPGAGRMQNERMQRALAGARTMQNYAFENLNYLSTRLFPPRSQIVFVSPLSIDSFDALVRYKALGYDLLVISPNPVQFESKIIDPAHPDEDRALAIRLATIERELFIRRLKRYGVWVVDWKVNRPLTEALRDGLAPLHSAQRMLRL